MIVMAIVFLILSILSTILKISQTYYTTKLSHEIGSEFGIQIYKNYLTKSYQENIEENSSRIVSAIISKTGVIIFNIVNPCLNIIITLMIISMAVTFLAIINLQITIILTVSVIVFYILIHS
jgi:ABC-type bacteriocin/lantibiotic exporter with double-glycine peptidase domain